MAEVTTVSVEIAGTEISFETGRMAKQASGAVVVRAGDTMVLSTATAGNERDVDFLPLTVDVEEWYHNCLVPDFVDPARRVIARFDPNRLLPDTHLPPYLRREKSGVNL